MLDYLIIEEIRRREERDERPAIQLPLPEPYPLEPEAELEETQRGVVVVDI